MRKISVAGLSLLLLLSLCVTSMAQEVLKQSVIKPEALSVTFEKTTNLIFPYAIKSVDKGSKDLLAQVAGGVENILQVKAAKQGFTETNLTVVTSDGKLYSFLVNYVNDPPNLNIKLDGTSHTLRPDALFNARNDNEAKVHDLAEQVALKKTFLKRPRDRQSDITMALNGIYIRSDVFYFQLRLENSSQVNYTIDQLRFYIHDKNQAKRTAVQELELRPGQFCGNTEIIRGRSAQTIVVVLPKFTIPDKKYLSIQLMEQNGGRHLQLKIKNKVLLKAIAL